MHDPEAGRAYFPGRLIRTYPREDNPQIAAYLDGQECRVVVYGASGRIQHESTLTVCSDNPIAEALAIFEKRLTEMLLDRYPRLLAELMAYDQQRKATAAVPANGATPKSNGHNESTPDIYAHLPDDWAARHG